VAVVQISKIQVRRGQKLQGSGLPQLASGELGWAVDTRELYIGNGAVAEGAPAVGNTKVLTEYDDLFALADTYTYRIGDDNIVTGTNSSNQIRRSLQQRLDDLVSVRSFGVIGDGVTNDTLALQRAIDQSFLTSVSASGRVELVIEAGTYIIDDTIYIPPYATIVGAGKDKTIIRQTVNKPAFITVNSTSTPGAPATDSTSSEITQATNIYMRGLTIETTAAGAGGANIISVDVGTPDSGKALILETCKDSVFEDISFKGVWANGTPLHTDSGVVINSKSSVVESRNNTFKNCSFEGFGAAVRSKWDIDNTIFDKCEFSTCGWGIIFGYGLTLGAAGQITGPVDNTIRNSNFTNIFRNAIWVEQGTRNTSESNKFKLCGNNGGTEVQPQYSVIKYNNNGNKSVHDFFERTRALSQGPSLSNVSYLPEVEGSIMTTLEYENTIEFGPITNVRLFRLPSIANQGFNLDYTIVSRNYRVIRSGTLQLVFNAYDDTVDIADDFQFIGDENYVDNINFLASADLTNQCIDVKVTSTMPIDDTTELKYTVTTKKTNIV